MQLATFININPVVIITTINIAIIIIDIMARQSWKSLSSLHSWVKVETDVFSYTLNYPSHPNWSIQRTSSNVFSIMFCWLILRRGCLLKKPNFVVADHHHHAADRHHHVVQYVCVGVLHASEIPQHYHMYIVFIVMGFYLSNFFMQYVRRVI